jgi:hypothetical protein
LWRSADDAPLCLPLPSKRLQISHQVGSAPAARNQQFPGSQVVVQPQCHAALNWLYLRGPLMLLAYAFDPVPVVAAIMRKLFGDLIQSAWRGPTLASIRVELRQRPGVEFCAFRSVLPTGPVMAVFFAAGGFAITNINSGIEARAERQTSDVPSRRMPQAWPRMPTSAARGVGRDRRTVDARADVKAGSHRRPLRSASPLLTGISSKLTAWCCHMLGPRACSSRSAPS